MSITNYAWGTKYINTSSKVFSVNGLDFTPTNILITMIGTADGVNTASNGGYSSVYQCKDTAGISVTVSGSTVYQLYTATVSIDINGGSITVTAPSNAMADYIWMKTTYAYFVWREE